MGWLNDGLKLKIKKIFESRYKRQITDDEIEKIAGNLSNFMEILLKMKTYCKHESK